MHHALCPMPYALSPMPYALCPLPDAPYPPRPPTQNQASGIWHPVSGFQHPASGIRYLVSNIFNPESCHLKPGHYSLCFTTAHLTTRYSQPTTRDPQHATRPPASSIQKKRLPVFDINEFIEQSFFFELRFQLQGRKVHRFIAQTKSSPVQHH